MERIAQKTVGEQDLQIGIELLIPCLRMFNFHDYYHVLNCHKESTIVLCDPIN